MLRLMHVVALAFLCPAAVADSIEDGYLAYRDGDFETAFELLAPHARPDNPGLQNLVALMLYRGRGTEADPVAAHELLHRAAMNGSVKARRNLGVMHTLGAPGVAVDFEEARIWFATTQGDENEELPALADIIEPFADDGLIAFDTGGNANGKRIYTTFCAGCHGFSGMHFFNYAPSFAMGQRMTKSDAELMESILRGRGLMPSWEDKLPLSDLEDALAYLRVLAIQTAYGMNTELDEEPDQYFIFYPSHAVPSGAPNPHAVSDEKN